MSLLIPVEVIENRILYIRDCKVMLSSTLADLYGVEHRALIQAVQRNRDRFPDDFMFQLTKEEFRLLKSHFVISSWGGIRKMPYAFTEQGIAMLSSVLKSKRAIQVNIQIIRTFTNLRALFSTHKEVLKKLEDLERKYESHDKHIITIFAAIRQLVSPPKSKKYKVGF